MGNIALSHRQSTKLSTARLIAQRLDGADIGSALTASNQGHEGVFVAYARNRLADYLGTPLAANPDAVTAELHAAGARALSSLGRPGSTPARPIAAQPALAVEAGHCRSGDWGDQD